MPDESKEVRHSLEQELISRGMRMTHQRRLLIQIIQSAESHLDAIALWERARNQDPTLNKVTVYRTLAMLKKLGLVDELDLMHLQGGKHYYEAKATRDHVHLACLNCGRIQEFESSLFEKLKGQIERERRFSISVVRVEAGGYCAECREQRIGAGRKEPDKE
jgi:Fur family ferric uptake transcriptional regulator